VVAQSGPLFATLEGLVVCGTVYFQHREQSLGEQHLGLLSEAPLMDSSRKLGLTSCNKCGECCRFSPCLLVPSDVERITAKLGKSFIGTLQIERTPEQKYLVRMGKPCVFFVDNQCSIHDFKPTGGRDYECWNDETWKTTYFWQEGDVMSLMRRAA
jgi:Fe-S-cluster containining protein